LEVAAEEKIILKCTRTNIFEYLN